MSNDASGLKERLELLADTFGEPRHVDIERARRRGRRILLRRRVTAAAGGVAAIGLAVAAAASVLAGPPPAPSGPPAPPGLRPSALSTAYADPLLQTASFGWLPAGFRVTGRVTDDQDRPYFQAVAQVSGATGPAIWLTDYGRGPQPGLPLLPGGSAATPVRAAPVDGHPADWIIQPAAGPRAQLNFELRWQYAPGSWADLQAAGWSAASPAQLAAAAYKIADSAGVGETRPVAMPLHVTGMPGGLQPRRAVLITSPQVSALIEYSGPANSGSDSLSVSVGPAGAITHRPVQGARPRPAGKGIAPNTVIGGHPAYDSQISDPRAASAILWVFGVRGFDVRIDASGSILRSLQRTGGLAGLFSRMTVYASPSAWTSTPVN